MSLKGIGRLVAGLAVVSLIAAGCGSSDDDENTLEVVLSEWIVEAEDTSIDAGEWDITAKNEGGETHELVIVKADSVDDFVLDDTGKVLEDEFAEGAFIGEIEEFEAGTEETATFDLDAGTYIFFCNIVEEEDDGSFESHYLEGMVQTITVG